VYGFVVYVLMLTAAGAASCSAACSESDPGVLKLALCCCVREAGWRRVSFVIDGLSVVRVWRQHAPGITYHVFSEFGPFPKTGINRFLHFPNGLRFKFKNPNSVGKCVIRIF
jgi:hypothetical protein